ncbi:ATP-grasp domain-containing protein [[Mycoplasma] testudinis]|uniref:ATP-grasp domain-containing protein n=1 Tax=[Mycoplasma] testudinis TaxID=33924 RepID=UPI00048420D8|nr:ATP-grasp domain-containing protein [[Mycoplasma] testudinis]
MNKQKKENKTSIALIYAKNDYQINHHFADAILKEFETHNHLAKLILIDPNKDEKIDLTGFDVIINRSRKIEFLEGFQNKRHIFNQPDFTKMANDKFLTFQWMKFNSIRCLTTELLNFRKAKDYKYPIVVKKRDGHGGSEVYKFNSYKDLELKNLDPQSHIVQEFFKNGDVDVRVYVMFGKILSSIKRQSPQDDFRSNVSVGGGGNVYKLTFWEKIYIKKIIKMLPLGYYSLDFFWKANKLILNEIEDVTGSRMIQRLGLKIDIPKILVKNIIHRLKKADNFQNEILTSIKY